MKLAALLIASSCAVPHTAAHPASRERPTTVWDRLAVCESSGDWQTNTSNGYFGGLQEDLTFWHRYGGSRYAPRPDLATRSQQITVASRGLAVQGWGAWPDCSRKLGLK